MQYNLEAYSKDLILEFDLTLEDFYDWTKIYSPLYVEQDLNNNKKKFYSRHVSFLWELRIDLENKNYGCSLMCRSSLLGSLKLYP